MAWPFALAPHSRGFLLRLSPHTPSPTRYLCKVQVACALHPHVLAACPPARRLLKPNNASAAPQLDPDPDPAERELPMDGLGLERLSGRGVTTQRYSTSHWNERSEARPELV